MDPHTRQPLRTSKGNKCANVRTYHSFCVHDLSKCTSTKKTVSTPHGVSAQRAAAGDLVLFLIPIADCVPCNLRGHAAQRAGAGVIHSLSLSLPLCVPPNPPAVCVTVGAAPKLPPPALSRAGPQTFR
ncbi:hypothetical protein DQ04_11621010 [Trypanosoma grayi]|uniref:hypothetical protein n=1 Tax=Trypanosoma grayi TaxID=71804 RepID=UPI0004F428F1|nr:hypothetical protein DQ04_11621010 [Trypanosoma grayi]KEG06926.1 hypothetical protein DQ04_11621010 [Trypanosoma grayi]